jgi:hypothetical protein
MVASAGAAQWSGASRRAPSAARTGCGASAAHSAIALSDPAPVSTAAAAMATIRDPRVAAPGRMVKSRSLEKTISARRLPAGTTLSLGCMSKSIR